MPPHRPRIRPTELGDIDKICALLEAGFRRPAAMWRSLFDYPWSHSTGLPDRGCVIADDQGIHGFCGAVIARRNIAGLVLDICNLSSWYVRDEYRHLGTAMLLQFTRIPSLHITNLTPARHTAAAMKALGFSFANDKKFLLPPLINGRHYSRNASILSALPDLEGILNDTHRQILDDHRKFFCHHYVIADQDGYAYIVTKRRPKRGFPCTEILYCSDPMRLTANLEPFKVSVLARDRALALIVDPRFLASRPRFAITYNRASFFRSKLLSVEDIDGLYSELVLLPI